MALKRTLFKVIFLTLLLCGFQSDTEEGLIFFHFQLSPFTLRIHTLTPGGIKKTLPEMEESNHGLRQVSLPQVEVAKDVCHDPDKVDFTPLR